MQKDYLTVVPEQQSLALALLIMPPMNAEQGTKKKRREKYITSKLNNCALR